MKVIMGMAQAVFGIIFIGFVALFTMIGIVRIATEDVINYVKILKIRKEV